MTKRVWPVALFLLIWARAAASQDLRGFLVLDGHAGYLTNGYLESAFATWTPEIEAGFGTIAATGLLEWTGGQTSVSVSANGRAVEWADSTPSWSSYLLRAGIRRRVGRRLSVGVETSYADVHRPASRNTLWGRASLEWTASPQLRLGFGPGIGRTRFGASPPLDTGTPPPQSPDAETATQADSYVLFASVEGWPSRRWQVRAEGYGARTNSQDLGIDSDGFGGSLRLTRWLENGAAVTLGGRLEGFSYRAALEGGVAVIPDDDMIWRLGLGVEWPLGRRVKLRGEVAGLGGPEGDMGRAIDGYGIFGATVTLGGLLAAHEAVASLWVSSVDGMRIRVPYRGAGQLYVVGDFNDWADPGTRLLPDGEGGRTATLGLTPGSYRFRVRITEDGVDQWLELPDETLTEDDGFGGRNGVLVVPEGLSGNG